ncbi:MAG: M67 family metallopeptidase [Planctomycetia bacterium]
MPAKVTNVWMSASALAHVLAATGPNKTEEPCGLLLGYRVALGAEVLEAVSVRNAHQTPARAFRMETEDLLVAGRAGRAKGLDIVGIWHGHLQGPAWPGELDLEQMHDWQALNPQSVWIVVGKGSTGRQMVRAFRLGRTRPKKVRLQVLKRARGSAMPRPAAPPAPPRVMTPDAGEADLGGQPLSSPLLHSRAAALSPAPVRRPRPIS